jgi:hypothetical protein
MRDKEKEWLLPSIIPASRDGSRVLRFLQCAYRSRFSRLYVYQCVESLMVAEKGHRGVSPSKLQMR